jgi:hypothetical protein
MSYKAPERNVPTPSDKIQLTRAAMKSLDAAFNTTLLVEQYVMTAEFSWAKREDFVESRIAVLAGLLGCEFSVWLETEKIGRDGDVLSEVEKSHLWVLFKTMFWHTIENRALGADAEPGSSN